MDSEQSTRHAPTARKEGMLVDEWAEKSLQKLAETPVKDAIRIIQESETKENPRTLSIGDKEAT